MEKFSKNQYSTKNEDKELLIDKVKEGFALAVQRHATENDEKKKWLLRNCRNLGTLYVKSRYNLLLPIIFHVFNNLNWLIPMILN